MFYIEYARACLDKLPNSLPSKWKGDDCELTVIINEGVFEAVGSFKQRKSGLLAAAFAGSMHDEFLTINVRWSGTLLGRGARFSFWRNQDDSRSTLLGGAINLPSKGLMIVSEDLREMRFYEKATAGKGKFYKWESLE